MTTLSLFIGALFGFLVLLALVWCVGRIIAAVSEPDPFDSEREYKRGTPGDREE